MNAMVMIMIYSADPQTCRHNTCMSMIKPYCHVIVKSADVTMRWWISSMARVLGLGSTDPGLKS